MISFLDRLIESIFSKIKILSLRAEGAEIGSGVKICRRVQLKGNKKGIHLGNHSSLDRGSVLLLITENLQPSIHLGKKTYINRNTILDCSNSISLGNNCLIGANCYITDHDHAFQGLPPEKEIGSAPLTGHPIVIGNNVWIGSNSVILKGVNIGDNSIIGAGSIVTKSIPPNSIAVGNPCKVVKTKN